MARQSYLKNAAILTGTGLLLRAAGMFFRIYIAARIGAEGMGLYQLIYTVYTMAVTLATAGLSVAATRLSAELLATDDPANVRAAMRRTLALGLGLGAAAAALLFTGAGLAADWWLEDARAALSLRILAPSLPFMAVSACLRGFFMARRKVGPNSRAQIFEQVVRIGVVALLIDSAVPQGIGTACAAVVVGNTVSEAASWVYMEWCYRRELRDVPRNAKRPVQGLGRQLWDIIAPIAANQYMTSVLRTVENVMVPGCLALYTLSRETALSQYGALKGMAMPVIFFPFSFLATLSTLLLPEITEAHVQNRRAALEHLVNRVMLITLVLSFLAGGLFTQFAKEIGLVLYQSEEIGFYLSILGPLMPFMYMESMVDGILKGLGGAALLLSLYGAGFGCAHRVDLPAAAALRHAGLFVRDAGEQSADEPAEPAPPAACYRAACAMAALGDKTGVLVFVRGRGVPVRAAAADAAAGPAASGLGCFGSGIHQRYLRAVHLAYRLRRAGRLYRQAHPEEGGGEGFVRVMRMQERTPRLCKMPILARKVWIRWRKLKKWLTEDWKRIIMLS